MSTARYYAPYNQDNPAYPVRIPGVPLADIDAETWEALPAFLQEAADASGLYLKSKPPAKKVAKAEKAAEKAAEVAQEAAEEDES